MKSVSTIVSNLFLALSSHRNYHRSSIAPVVFRSGVGVTLSSMAVEAEAEATATTATTNEGSSRGKNEDGLSLLSKYHPVVIEGMGYYDPRDPRIVASQIVSNLRHHWKEHRDDGRDDKPLLVISQGDPVAPKGISAITPLVAKEISALTGTRGLVCLDDDIDPSHSENADRTGVLAEIKYSDLVETLQKEGGGGGGGVGNINIMNRLEEAVDAHISKQNEGRAAAGKPPVKDYFKTYAMLQEVTKAGLRALCGGEITVAHTSPEINPFSVTSFYEVGLELGLYQRDEVARFVRGHGGGGGDDDHEPLDFGKIDPR